MLKPTAVPQTYAHPILTPAFATGRPQCYDHTGTICRWYRHNSRAARHPADIQPSDRGSGTAQSSSLLPIQHNHALTHTQLDSLENIAIRRVSTQHTAPVCLPCFGTKHHTHPQRAMRCAKHSPCTVQHARPTTTVTTRCLCSRHRAV